MISPQIAFERRRRCSCVRCNDSANAEKQCASDIERDYRAINVVQTAVLLS